MSWSLQATDTTAGDALADLHAFQVRLKVEKTTVFCKLLRITSLPPEPGVSLASYCAKGTTHDVTGQSGSLAEY